MIPGLREALGLQGQGLVRAQPLRWRDTSPVSRSSVELAREVLGALSTGDVALFASLVHPEIEIVTSRGTRRGKEEAEEWAQKRYEHLERRFAIDELREEDGAILALVRTQYVWRESGLVGDEEPTVIELGFCEGKLIRWAFREDLGPEDGTESIPAKPSGAD